jgi:hypothetical protein
MGRTGRNAVIAAKSRPQTSAPTMKWSIHAEGTESSQGGEQTNDVDLRHQVHRAIEDNESRQDECRDEACDHAFNAFDITTPHQGSPVNASILLGYVLSEHAAGAMISPMKQPDPHTSRWTKPTENCSHQANP